MKSLYDFEPISKRKANVYNELANIYAANEAANNDESGGVEDYEFEAIKRTPRMDAARKEIDSILNGHWCNTPSGNKIISKELTEKKVWRYFPTMRSKRSVFANLMAYVDDYFKTIEEGN